MKQDTDRLKERIRRREQEASAAAGEDPYRLRLHLMPKAGWLNDPNGLCRFGDTFHVFFQYAPFDADGGLKLWGHYTSQDLLHWEAQEPALLPDRPFDRDGVYSGCAYVTQDAMYLYYTGNVKQEGEHDYITSGREANTVLVESADGIHFGEKELLLTNRDYPQDYTCHIRDPKVWEEDGMLYMVQGGRKLEDRGAVLLFAGKDPRSFRFVREVTTEKPFGYMWECPDYFELQGVLVLSCSPQGVGAEEYRYQNVYQSGYFILSQKLTDAGAEHTSLVIPEENSFREWDMGFDFYAPQTFEDRGRRLLIGWAGIPDADYDNAPASRYGWQHALTLIRELTVRDGKVCQNPVGELTCLRGRRITILPDQETDLSENVFELNLSGADQNGCRFTLACGEERLSFSWRENAAELLLTEKAGRGRKRRSMLLPRLEELRIYVDTSMIEIYVNQGEAVFTSRFYFPGTQRSILAEGFAENTLWYLEGTVQPE